MEAGIVGMPYVGKTTLFNALTGLGVSGDAGANKPNVGIANVPDPRLGILAEHIPTKKVVPATIQLVDVAGLSAGASEGKGAGNKFLAHVRNVDALVQVVRCYDDPGLGAADPVGDIATVETELILADMQTVESNLDKARRTARTGEKQAKARLEILEKCNAALEDEKPVRSIDPGGADGARVLRELALLTAKPVLYVANIAEDDAGAAEPPHAAGLVAAHAQQTGGQCVVLCAKLEAELAELDESERQEMLEGLGVAEPALHVMARAAYALLGLQSFFTAGEKEIKAWTIRIGETAPEAAGEIHSDIQRGFIRAEIYSVDDLVQHKTEAAIKAAGRLRVEGKDYVMRDGDVCHYLFNV